jgi:hypothetical protein
VQNFAHVPLDRLRPAQRHVERVYQAIDVRIVWADANAANEPGSGVVLDVLFLSAEMTRHIGHVSQNTRALGVAAPAAGRAYIFYQRVIDAAMNCRTAFEQVFGHVVAHELGHLLLPESGHAAQGVMRADFEAGRPREGAFTREQRARIHARLAASHG